jgi:hypothetical protein
MSLIFHGGFFSFRRRMRRKISVWRRKKEQKL